MFGQVGKVSRRGLEVVSSVDSNRHAWDATRVGKNLLEHLPAERVQCEGPAVALSANLNLHRSERPLGGWRVDLDYLPGVVPGAFLEFVGERPSFSLDIPNVKPSPVGPGFGNSLQLG